MLHFHPMNSPMEVDVKRQAWAQLFFFRIKEFLNTLLSDLATAILH